MIFVTVGTHEQQFNRLVEYMDKWASGHDEEVVIQTGYSTYKPKNCKYRDFYPYDGMLKNVDKARIVITHGGPSSYIMPLQMGKVPVVVPRSHEYNEHINNHQVDFCDKISKLKRNIIVVREVEKLGDILDKYDEVAAGIRNGMTSNNEEFCRKFEKIVTDLLSGSVDND